MKLGIAASVVAWDDDNMGLACQLAEEYPRQRIIQAAPKRGIVVKGARKQRRKQKKACR